MSEQDDQLLTLDEVAAKLRVSRETARRLCASGKLTFVSVGIGADRHARRVRKGTLAAFIQNERRGAIRQQFSAVRQTQAALRLTEQRW